MSTLDKYYRDVQGALKKLIDSTQERQTNLILRKAYGDGPTFTPASTCEEVAMTAVELSSRARTLQEVNETLKQAYRSLFEKDSYDPEQD